MSSYLFLSICNCVGALCTLMFQLQVVWHQIILINHSIWNGFFLQSASKLSIEIYQAFGIGSLILLFLFLFSYFGEMVTVRSLVIADSVWDSLWYQYPTKLQKYMQLTIGYSHIQFHYSGLGLMYCTMASFSGVGSFFNIWDFSIAFFNTKIFHFLSLVYFQLVKTSVSFFMLFRNVA